MLLRNSKKSISVFYKLFSTQKILFRFSSVKIMSTNCIFCKIIAGDEKGEILYQDDEMVVFKDIKPSSKFHFLSVPKEHILNVNSLSSEHVSLINRLILNGKKVVEESGGNVEDVRLGFHCPPFNSVSHLHLHVISPATEMSFLGRMIFKPNTWWFSSVDQILEKLETNKINNKL